MMMNMMRKATYVNDVGHSGGDGYDDDVYDDGAYDGGDGDVGDCDTGDDDYDDTGDEDGNGAYVDTPTGYEDYAYYYDYNGYAYNDDGFVGMVIVMVVTMVNAGWIDGGGGCGDGCNADDC